MGSEYRVEFHEKGWADLDGAVIDVEELVGGSKEG